MAVTFNLTRTEIIEMALRRLGVTNPSNDDVGNAVKALGVMVRASDARLRAIWKISNTESTVTTVAAQRAYDNASDSLPADIYALEQVSILNGSNYELLTELDKLSSITTVDKDGTARPNSYHLEVAPLAANQKLHLFPTPNGAYTIKINYQKMVDDFGSASANPDFPQRWLDALVKSLTLQLAPEYGLQVPKQQWHERLADQAINLLLGDGDPKEDLPPQQVQPF